MENEEGFKPKPSRTTVKTKNVVVANMPEWLL